ncbi:MAG: aspartate racemase [Acidobacteria bacterium]|nr:MAG: aspartate racemase [Acidobacteriota bacterium]
MKTLGILGGLGPESTIEYYRRILGKYAEHRSGAAPSIIINSIDVNRGLRMLGEGQLEQLTDYLVESLQPLERAGADFALISANTPHIVFDQVQRRSNLPLISIVERTCARAKALGLKNLALLGTRFTMQASFYAQVFSREGLSVIVPNQSEQNYIHRIYIEELLKGVVLPETREGLTKAIIRLKTRDGSDGIILGGTELSLMFREPSVAEIPVMDTTEIHVEAAVTELLRD